MDKVTHIGLIGDYDASKPSHRATDEALRHCAESLGMPLEARWVATETLAQNAEPLLRGLDGIWCAPGSPYQSMQGALNAIQYARENMVPFIGTCGGFQHAVIEFARNVLGAAGAQHAEYEPDAAELIVIPLCCSLVGESRTVFISKDTLAYRCYTRTETVERFSCSFGLAPAWRQRLQAGGFTVSGADENSEVRILELASHPFYIASLFQPQLSSTPKNPHPLILAFLQNASHHRKGM